MLLKIPIVLLKYLIKNFLGVRNSLSKLKCVSKYFNFIEYHQTNHIKCCNCKWYVKNFHGNHICNQTNCMLIKSDYKKFNYYNIHKCRLGKKSKIK
jgi:hypothetical protein